MKKYYSLLLVGLLPMAMLGQSTSIQYMDEEPIKVHAPSSDLYDYKSGGGVYWEEDFGNGFPAGWSVDNPGGLCPWKWTMNGSHGFWNGTSATDYDDPLASTTGANGFLISDTDSANHFNFGQPSGTTYQYIDSYFTTDAIDLSAHPSVKLEFEHAFRYNNDLVLEVMVSNDSLNWTTWDVAGNSNNNVASPNPELVGINITSVAGSQSTVYIRIGWSSRVYFWMIDDMRIIEAPENDLKLTNFQYDEWFFDQAADFSTLEFSVYPMSQARPLNFKGNVLNDGTAAQSNVTLTVDVEDDNNTSVFNGSSQLASLAPADNDSLYVTGFTPSATGRFDVSFEITSDSVDLNPDDNVGEKWFEVSDYIFGRDTGGVDGNWDNQDEAYEIGNWFNIQNQDEQLYGINVAIDDASAVGVTIYGIIRDANRDPIDETEEYEITANDLNATGEGKFVTLVFASPVDVFQGEDYLVMVGHYGGPDNVQLGTSGISPAQTSLLWDVPAATWFYITSTPMVRMNFDPSVSIEDQKFEHGIRLGQNYPNPFYGNSQVTYELESSTEVSFEIHDLTGKVINTIQLGNVSQGLHMIDLSSIGMSDGIYFYTLKTNEHSITKRMLVAGNK